MDLESKEAQVIFPHSPEGQSQRDWANTDTEFAEEPRGSSNQLICLAVVVNRH